MGEGHGDRLMYPFIIMAKKTKQIEKIDIKIIPFRIKPSNTEDDYSEVYEFLIKGTNKDPYIVEIFIDSLNDLGITFETCTCPHFKFRAEECKHIKHCKTILKEFKVNGIN